MTLYPTLTALSTAALLALTACGGGGGDAPTAESAAVAVTADNIAQAQAASPAVGALSLVSADSAGRATGGEACAVSADGGLVAFSSGGAVIGANVAGTNAVYLKNTRSGAVSRVSSSAAGVALTAASTCVGMTPDGRSVVFITTVGTSGAIYPGGGTQESALFVKNLQSGALTRISPPAASLATTAGFQFSAISDDGQRVLFVGLPTVDYLGGYSWRINGPARALVRDVAGGSLVDLSSTVRLDVSINGVLDSTLALSPDGQQLAFSSQSDYPAVGDSNGQSDVLVHNLSSGALQLATASSAGVQAVGSDGRYAVLGFLASGTRLAFDTMAASSLGSPGVYAKTLGGGALAQLAARDANVGSLFNGASGVIFSDDARKAVFTRYNASTRKNQAMLRTLASGAEQRIDRSATGTQGNGASQQPLLSRDGSSVAFFSNATNLASIGRLVTYQTYLKTIDAPAVTVR